MNLLNALLAFSITMLMLSTMSLVVVETIHRVLRIRQKYFRQIIEHFYDAFIDKLLDQLRLDSTSAELRTDFVQTMMSVTGLRKMDYVRSRSESITASDDANAGVNESWKRKLINKITGAEHKQTERLDNVEFVQRLANTQVGKAMMAKGDTYVRSLILDLTRQLDAISAGSSSNFRQRSRYYAFLSALFIAPFVNVDSVYLFRAFTQDVSLTARVIELGPEAEQAFNLSEQRIQELENAMDKAGQKEGVDEEVEKLLADASKQLQEARSQALNDQQKLIDAGVPIGAHYFPYCKPLETSKTAVTDSPDEEAPGPRFIDKRCQQAGKTTTFERIGSAEGVGWIVGIVLSIILIGQGSPFWFQMFQRLSVVSRVARSFMPAASKDDKGKSKDVEEIDTSAERAVEIFMDAKKLWEFTGK